MGLPRFGARRWVLVGATYRFLCQILTDAVGAEVASSKDFIKESVSCADQFKISEAPH